MSFFFDPNVRGKIDELKKLPMTRGFCVVADIVESVREKDRPTAEWACLFANTLSMVRWILCGGGIQKVIGDAVMGFVAEEEFNLQKSSMLSQFCRLVDFAHECNPPHVLPVRMAVVYCVNAYELSFIEGAPDVYGKDIDLAFRLVGRAKKREVLMNREVYDRLGNECQHANNSNENAALARLYSQIQGPDMMEIRGFAQPVPTYRLPAILH